MKMCTRTPLRARLVRLAVFAGLAAASGCSNLTPASAPAASPVAYAAAHNLPVSPPASPAASPYVRSPIGMDDYKAQVARHVAEHNPERTYNGILPPLLPAVVVLRITVDRDGQLADVHVQRSRNPAASEVALASLRRSTPLPRPYQLAQATGQLTFSETFLFADRERYQLRSLAAPQASE